MSSRKSVKSFYEQVPSLREYLSERDQYLSKQDKPEYKFNIIGAGNIAREHMNVIMMEGRGTVHGIFDINCGIAEETKDHFEDLYPKQNIIIYDDLDEVCSDKEVDALVICTPNYTHYDIVKTAMKYGKHILLEKPMASTLEDAYKMMKLAEDYDAVFQVGLQYRYKAMYKEAYHEVLERKSIGDIKTISIMEHRIPFLDKVNQWNKFQKFSGGTFVEKCCHYFDLFNLFSQAKPKEVFATGSAAVNFTEFEYDGMQSDIVDNAFVNVVYENGIRANLNLCMFSPMFYEEVVLCGDEGRLKGSETEHFTTLNKPRYSMELMRVDGEPSKIMTPAFSEHVEKSGHGGSSYYEQVDFVDQIEGILTQKESAKEGFWSIVISVAAEKSLKENKVINIKQLLENRNMSV